MTRHPTNPSLPAIESALVQMRLALKSGAKMPKGKKP